MSAIASFHVVAKDSLGDLMAAATPASRGWFRAAQDAFPDLLRKTGRALDIFDGSGWVFGTLDLYLESRHNFMYANFGDATASRQLSKARGSDWLVIDGAAAARLRAVLDGVAFEAGDLTAFVAGEHGSDGAAEEAAAVEAALAKLKAWLSEVPPGSVGLLSIG